MHTAGIDWSKEILHTTEQVVHTAGIDWINNIVYTTATGYVVYNTGTI